MKIYITLLLTLALLNPSTSYSSPASSDSEVDSDLDYDTESDSMDELDPFDPNIGEILKELDRRYRKATGKSPIVKPPTAPQPNLPKDDGGCIEIECSIYVRISKNDQRLYLYMDGNLEAAWAVSTGTPGHDTPDFNRRPNGRIYDAYRSKKYPEGDYNGLGNMPYAVFIEGGFAIHGTTTGNFKRLGKKASHGCIRLHPENAKVFNRLVREYGIDSTWITVED